MQLTKWLSNKIPFNFFTGIIKYGLSSAIFQGSRFIGEIVLMVIVGPLYYGYWKLWQLIFTYSPLVQLGIPSGANRNIPYLVGKSENQGVETTFNTAFTSVIFGSFFSGLLTFIIVYLSSRNVVENSILFSILFSFAVISWNIFMSLMALLRAFRSYNKYQLNQYIVSTVLICLLVLVYFFGLIGFLLDLFIASIVGSLMAYILFENKPILQFNFGAFKKLFAVGFPLTLAGIAYSFLTTTDRMIIAGLLGADIVGDYSLPITVFMALALVPLTITQYFYPIMNNVYGKKDSLIVVYKECKRQLLLSFILTLIAVVFVFLFLEDIVIKYLPEYAIGIKPTYYLLPGVLGLSFVGGFGNFLNTANHQKFYLITQILSILLNLLVSISAIFLGYGIIGVALSSSITYLIYALALYFVTRRILAS